MEDLRKIIEGLRYQQPGGAVLLLLAIVESGLNDGDVDYFKCEGFHRHAVLLGWDVERFYKLAIQTIEKERDL